MSQCFASLELIFRLGLMTTLLNSFGLIGIVSRGTHKQNSYNMYCNIVSMLGDDGDSNVKLFVDKVSPSLGFGETP